MSQNANKPLSENKTWQAIGAYAEAKEEIARLTAENERLKNRVAFLERADRFKIYNHETNAYEIRFSEPT